MTSLPRSSSSPQIPSNRSSLGFISSIHFSMWLRTLLLKFVRKALLLAVLLIRPLRGWAFALIVFGTSIFGNYIVTIFLPLVTLLNRHKQWREMMDRAITFWMLIPLFFLHFVFRVRVRASGDQIRLDEPAIIILNHRTRLDWFYFWLVLWRMNPWLMTRNKIALKELLRHVPGTGFGMQGMMFVFLKRDLQTDSARMSRAVDYYADMGRPYQIMMFPEGTDKTRQTTARSDQFAEKEGLPRLRHVLYPRTAGFVHLVQKMRQRNYLAQVYDVTVAYPGELVQNETDMILKGKLARQVHFDVRRFGQEELPESAEGLNKWIMDLWTEKDRRLESFYSEPIWSKRRLEPSAGTEGNIWAKDDWLQLAIKAFGFCFWCSVVPVWLFHLSFLPFVQVGFGFLLLNYALIYGIYGGIDELILCRWERHKRRSQTAMKEQQI